MKSQGSLRKKTVFNILMVFGIVVILGGGLLAVGNLKGWFGDGNAAVSNSIKLVSRDAQGIVNVERSGIGYFLSDGSTLRVGDIVETLQGSHVTFASGGTRVTLNEGTEVALGQTEGGMKIEVNRGEVFCDIDGAGLTFGAGSVLVAPKSGDVLYVSGQQGSKTVASFKGALSAESAGEVKEVAQGSSLSVVTRSDGTIETSVNVMQKSSLNDFVLSRVATVATTKDLSLTAQDAQGVIDARAQEKAAAFAAALANDTALLEAPAQTQATSVAPGTTAPGATAAPGTTATTAAPGATAATDPPQATAAPGAPKMHATIEISCKTILDNMGDLSAGKGAFVPSTGVILPMSSVEFTEGETAFDVLKRVCQMAGIQIEYSWFPIYDSYYIEGINHLYEFDCGAESGWMYKVNGWYPNYGCSAYELKDGDVISWNYTVKGLGADLGSPMSR
jgi:hypothetical protein